MTKIKRDATIEISASAEQLWKILADDFTEVSKWVDAVNTSGPNPAAPKGLNGSKHGGRVCDVQGLGKTVEVLTAYDNEQQTLSYSVAADNFPDFLVGIENSWSVQALAPNQSKVTVSLTVDVDGDGSADSPQVQFAEQIAGSVNSAGQQLKSYVESL
ncbi:SRPBCC family protein [Flexibacterium corallicola]|uniref:SRPBCC family protein n=1 Tax=Flexibacterium corallicola TaxID=3037259 RepID=UPI00286F5052|nr:SRPBCC family protein [Pseudovibrio sp. M1P-2-3]